MHISAFATHKAFSYFQKLLLIALNIPECIFSLLYFGADHRIQNVVSRRNFFRSRLHLHSINRLT
jgi:hypothetical protein